MAAGVLVRSYKMTTDCGFAPSGGASAQVCRCQRCLFLLSVLIQAGDAQAATINDVNLRGV